MTKQPNPNFKNAHHNLGIKINTNFDYSYVGFGLIERLRELWLLIKKYQHWDRGCRISIFIGNKLNPPSNTQAHT